MHCVCEVCVVYETAQIYKYMEFQFSTFDMDLQIVELGGIGVVFKFQIQIFCGTKHWIWN